MAGVAILYMNKGGEVSIFTGKSRCGFGSVLMRRIEDIARMRKMQSIWSWVLKDNIPARCFFEKEGFRSEGSGVKTYKGIVREGVVFRKILK